ncbi:MAG: LlaJI family restriction endonuclease [Erysipelotrichaceae bacterium]|nr:LlaJI family restriction endonuclease [Erysipelotrichaceae bacterium]
MALSSEAKEHLFLHEVTGEIDNSFVGLRIIGESIHVYHPECYPLSKDSSDFATEVLNLLKTFSLIKNLSEDESISYAGDSEGEFHIKAYVWIISDFLRNGFFINQERVYAMNQNGRINWKRTLNQQPLVSNGNVVYKDIVVEKKVDTDDTLLRIHKYCVKKSLDFLGWLFGIDSSLIDAQTVSEDLRSYYNYILQNELNNAFDDRKKELLSNMIIVLNGLNDYNTKKIISYGVDQYYYVYEKLVDFMFSNIDVTEFYPQGKWKLVHCANEIDSSHLRPDTVRTTEDSIYILDAKYYRYGYTADENDLPETSSIQKQIAYGEYAEKTHKGKEVYNAFVMPYDMTKDNGFESDSALNYIGSAYSTASNTDKSYNRIHAFLIDLKSLIDSYNRYQKDSQLINKLIEDIAEHSA